MPARALANGSGWGVIRVDVPNAIWTQKVACYLCAGNSWRRSYASYRLDGVTTIVEQAPTLPTIKEFLPRDLAESFWSSVCWNWSARSVQKANISNLEDIVEAIRVCAAQQQTTPRGNLQKSRCRRLGWWWDTWCVSKYLPANTDRHAGAIAVLAWLWRIASWLTSGSLFGFNCLRAELSGGVRDGWLAAVN